MDDGLWGQEEDTVDIDAAVGLQGKKASNLTDDIDVEIEKLLSVSHSDVYGGGTELLAQADAALDKAEVRDGVRRGHVAKGVCRDECTTTATTALLGMAAEQRQTRTKVYARSSTTERW